MMKGERRRRMTENKSSALTDAEIIKALECDTHSDCEECPYWHEFCEPNNVTAKEILDLINRRQAEIEDLKKIKENSLEIISMGEKQILEIREKSLKEFAERLKSRAHEISCNVLLVVTKDDIDNLVKEMAEPSLLDKKLGGDTE